MKSVAADLQNAIDEVLEFAGSRQGQMALEDDAVKTGEHGDDQAGKLGDEARQRLHGVLLWKGLVQTPFWRENAVFAHPLWLRLCRVGGREKRLCCVTTRGHNRWFPSGLGGGLGPLAAHALSLGVLGFNLGVLAMFGLPPCRLPTLDFP